MNKVVLAIPLALLAATPGHATGGLMCSTAGANPIQVSIVIGHTAVSSVVSARLAEGGRVIPVRVAQSWIAPAELRLDLTDPNALRHELRVRARAIGDSYDGSLWRHGKRHWVRCREA